MSALTEFTRIRSTLEQHGVRHATTGPNSEKEIALPTPGDPHAFAFGYDTRADFLDNTGRVDSIELGAHRDASQGTQVVFELDGTHLRKVVLHTEDFSSARILEQEVDARTGEVLSETPAQARGELNDFDRANLAAWNIAV